jgi:hypothetical protein
MTASQIAEGFKYQFRVITDPRIDSKRLFPVSTHKATKNPCLERRLLFARGNSYLRFMSGYGVNFFFLVLAAERLS